ncbi:hypothetical protein ACFE04_009652 [Oxalis oulophora]
MEEQITQLSIQDVEEEPWKLDETIDPNQISYFKCLVGTFLTTSIIYVDSMKKTLVNLWHLIGRFNINDLPNKRFLFRFFLDVDVERVIDGGSWTFHNHLMIEHKLTKGDDLDMVPLVISDMWVQIHFFPPGFITKQMVIKFDNYIGTFLLYDRKLGTKSMNKFISVRVQIDIRNPLAKKKKIVLSKDKFVYAEFRYGRLGLFCLICEELGHGESFCGFRASIRNEDVVFG